MPRRTWRSSRTMSYPATLAAPRRERADRVRDPRVPRDQECLTAAAAEIHRLAGARTARLRHPGVAAKPVERLRLGPDPLERVVAHVGELEGRDAARRVTRPHLAAGRDGHVRPAPPAHARLGVLLVVVRQHPDDLQLVAEPGALALHDRPGGIELRLRGHQRVPVVERPAVELRVRELYTLRAE